MNKKYSITYVLSIGLLLSSIWIGISFGSVNIPFSTLWDKTTDPVAYSILWKIRMPRVILAALRGQHSKGCLKTLWQIHTH